MTLIIVKIEQIIKIESIVGLGTKSFGDVFAKHKNVKNSQGRVVFHTQSKDVYINLFMQSKAGIAIVDRDVGNQNYENTAVISVTV
ncbi:hypothetical protein MKW98_008316 [Papaver atlanticum]|uniref:Uncharacterized protein n=1 Tax=Papaver atlanticum TaxID=357466 RepID=A0AAD4THK4_9MAGN|nr:hypothetical protein MKW98_008316 [Papaver atlanticum]